MTRIPITAQGASALTAELHRLKTTVRPMQSAAIAEARAHGDLKENAEYHAAREQQGLTEARIRDLEAKLAHAQIIDVTQIPNDGKVIFGATVRLCNTETSEILEYQIVSEAEADLKHGKISIGTPIARGLIGKWAGDEVTIQTPGGTVVYEIVAVDYR